MPVPGLSLLGFMDQAAGVSHLEQVCVPNSTAPAALVAEWATAKAQLGPPTQNAGQPQILPIPIAGQTHTNNLVAQPWLQPYLNDPGFCANGFGMVEIGTLLAFQNVVNKTRSNHHASAMSSPPLLSELLDACLPITPAPEDYTAYQQYKVGEPGSLIIKSRSLNLRILQGGQINGAFSGVHIGPSLPIVQVCVFNGRYYLTNGFHRAYCLARAGATHIPCLLRAPPTAEAVGINAGTFDLNLLQSNDPPTLAHYTTHKAYDVQLKLTSRIISLSWSEWAVSDE